MFTYENIPDPRC